MLFIYLAAICGSLALVASHANVVKG